MCRTWPLLLVGCLLALGACGNGEAPKEAGGDRPPVPEPEPGQATGVSTGRLIAILEAPAVPHLDGTVFNTGDFERNTLPAAGDTEILSARAILTFDLADLPDDWEMVDATLFLHQASTRGHPFHVERGLGRLVVDHIAPGHFHPASRTLYAGHTLEGPIGGVVPSILSTDPAPGRRGLDVTTQVLADVAAGRAFSQFRVRFETPTNFDLSPDLVGFTQTEDAATDSELPVLQISLVEGRRLPDFELTPAGSH